VLATLLVTSANADCGMDVVVGIVMITEAMEAITCLRDGDVWRVVVRTSSGSSSDGCTAFGFDAENAKTQHSSQVKAKQTRR
jgi:hypothetical protein